MRCRLGLQALEGAAAKDIVVPLSHLFPDLDPDRISQRNNLVRQLKVQCEELVAEHDLVPAQWSVGSNLYEKGLRDLLTGEIEKLCSEIEVRMPCTASCVNISALLPFDGHLMTVGCAYRAR